MFLGFLNPQGNFDRRDSCWSEHQDFGGHQNLAELDEKFRFSVRIMAERTAMQYAGKIITSTRQERFEQYGHPAYLGAGEPEDDGRFRVVPPGVNPEVFSTTASGMEAAIKDRIGYAAGRDIHPGRQALPLVVSSSRLDPKKNHLGLVRAFAQSADLQARANLAIEVRGADSPLRDFSGINPGEQAVYSEIVDIVLRSGLEGKVTAFPLNNQTELAAAYRLQAGRGSVFALTPEYEPFGLAPLEAISCGMPVVVTKNGGPSESLAEGGEEYGVLVDPEKPLDIARGLLEVLSSDGAWGKYHHAGLQRVREKYTWDRTADGHRREIEDLVRARGEAETISIHPYFETPGTDVPLNHLAEIFLPNGYPTDAIQN